MNQRHQPSDDLENDAVWNLLDRASPRTARPSFADDVVRMAKLEGQPLPWWKNWKVLAPSIGLAATAAVTLTLVISAEREVSAPVIATNDPAPVETDAFAEIQDYAETETLIAAADHLDDFSDQELVGLIGF